MTRSRQAVLASAAALALAVLAVPSGAEAQRPADWGESDWVKFIDTAVSGTLGDAYGAAGGRFPLVDVYSALAASGSAVKPGLQLSLRRKMAEAYSVGDYDRGDRYNIFFTCLTWEECDELREMQTREAADDGGGGGGDERFSAALPEGRYTCTRQGFGTLEITSAGAEFAQGTYTSTWDSSAKGRIEFRRTSGGWSGTWSEAAVGRRGDLRDVTVSAGGVSGTWVVTVAGRYQGRELPMNRGPFRCGG